MKGKKGFAVTRPSLRIGGFREGGRYQVKRGRGKKRGG